VFDGKFIILLVHEHRVVPYRRRTERQT